MCVSSPTPTTLADTGGARWVGEARAGCRHGPRQTVAGNVAGNVGEGQMTTDSVLSRDFTFVSHPGISTLFPEGLPQA